MELQILTSKKGTKVVIATELYTCLELPPQHYGTKIRRWLEDLYEFRDGIHRPVKLQNYAPRSVEGNAVLEDYFLSVELARHICMRSRSKVKKKIALRLQAAEQDMHAEQSLDKQEILHLLELTKAMSLRSCQEKAEQRHRAHYAGLNNGSEANWWTHRAQSLGYNADYLRRKMQQRKLSPQGKTQRDMLQQLDHFELIRAGVIDWYMSEGYALTVARDMGDIAKRLAQDLDLQVYEDRQGDNLFAPHLQEELRAKITQGERA